MLAFALEPPTGRLGRARLAAFLRRQTLSHRLARSMTDTLSSPTSETLGPNRPRLGSPGLLTASLAKIPLPTSGRLLATSAIALLAPPLAIAATAHLRAASVNQRVDAALIRVQGVAIVDRAGAFGGVRRHPEGDEERTVIPLRRAPLKAYFTMLRWAEDRHEEFAIYGMNVPATGWAILCKGASQIGARDLLDRVRRCTGASGLISAIVGAARGTGNPTQDVGIKFREIIDSWSVAVNHDLDDPHTQALVADAAPYATGIGGDVWGLELGARVIWSKEPSNLTIAQQAIAVTAFRRPIFLSCNVQAADNPLLPWDKRIDLAKHIVTSALPESPDRDAAVSELDTTAHIARPHMSDPMLAGLPFSKACQAAGNPVARANILASTVALRVDEELERGRGNHSVTEVRLSIDLQSNRDFVVETREELQRIDSSQRSRLARPLIGTSDDVADGAFAVVDDSDHFRHLYSGSGNRTLSTPQRSASLAKLIIAAAAALDGWSATDWLCNRMDDRSGAANSDGSRGHRTCIGPALVSPREAMARSQILPWLDLARKVNRASLASAIEAFGARVPTDVDPATAVGLGLVAPDHTVRATELGKTGSDVMDEEGNLRSKQVVGAFPEGSFYGGIWAPRGSLGRDVNMTPVWRWLRARTHGSATAR